MAYIDDIFIYTKDIEENNRVVLEVFNRFRYYEVKINFDKNKFLTIKFEILENMINT